MKIKEIIIIIFIIIIFVFIIKLLNYNFFYSILRANYLFNNYYFSIEDVNHFHKYYRDEDKYLYEAFTKDDDGSLIHTFSFYYINGIKYTFNEITKEYNTQNYSENDIVNYRLYPEFFIAEKGVFNKIINVLTTKIRKDKLNGLDCLKVTKRNMIVNFDFWIYKDTYFLYNYNNSWYTDYQFNDIEINLPDLTDYTLIDD